MVVVSPQARGTILIREKMFESRLFFVDQLQRMGARIILRSPPGRGHRPGRVPASRSSSLAIPRAWRLRTSCVFRGARGVGHPERAPDRPRPRRHRPRLQAALGADPFTALLNDPRRGFPGDPLARRYSDRDVADLAAREVGAHPLVMRRTRGPVGRCTPGWAPGHRARSLPRPQRRNRPVARARARLTAGEDVALVSEAGMPAIKTPGYRLVVRRDAPASSRSRAWAQRAPARAGGVGLSHGSLRLPGVQAATRSHGAAADRGPRSRRDPGRLRGHVASPPRSPRSKARRAGRSAWPARSPSSTRSS